LYSPLPFEHCHIRQTRAELQFSKICRFELGYNFKPNSRASRENFRDLYRTEKLVQKEDKILPDFSIQQQLCGKGKVARLTWKSGILRL
jgi:hypothetical protein